jgi:hypothetical protein
MCQHHHDIYQTRYQDSQDMPLTMYHDITKMCLNMYQHHQDMPQACTITSPNITLKHAYRHTFKPVVTLLYQISDRHTFLGINNLVQASFLRSSLASLDEDCPHAGPHVTGTN